jgi:hypothetical protein
MEPVYTIENGLYILSLGDTRIVAGKEVAILFDKASNLVLKHGKPECVQVDADITRKALATDGFPALADDLTVIVGAFDLEELNKVVSCKNYIGHFYQQLQDGSQRQAA